MLKMAIRGVRFLGLTLSQYQKVDTKPRTGRISELDGWRAVAAVMVIVSHVLGHQPTKTLKEIPWLFWPVYSMGYLGVQIFFVISGFVICRLLLREEARNGTFSLKGFYVRRVFRILPPFYLYLGVLALFALFGVIRVPGVEHANWPHLFAKAGLFAADYHSLTNFWFTGHTWSLAVEEQFYLFFPAVLLFTPRKWRVAACSAICALFIGWNLAASLTQGVLFLSTGVIAGFVCIFGGVLIALHEERARALALKLPAFLVIPAGALLLLQPDLHLNHWMEALYQGLVVPPVIAAMLLSTVDKPSWIQSFLCSRPVQAVGLTSYALYLWQQLFVGTPDLYSRHWIPLLFPLVALIVWLSWTYVEKPAMRIGRTLSQSLEESSRFASRTECSAADNPVVGA
jgi:peptidoglycan/LPS O-acetylase OafA/YrhL